MKTYKSVTKIIELENERQKEILENGYYGNKKVKKLDIKIGIIIDRLTERELDNYISIMV